jgi:hypothetical protein
MLLAIGALLPIDPNPQIAKTIATICHTGLDLTIACHLTSPFHVSIHANKREHATVSPSPTVACPRGLLDQPVSACDNGEISAAVHRTRITWAKHDPACVAVAVSRTRVNVATPILAREREIAERDRELGTLALSHGCRTRESCERRVRGLGFRRLLHTLAIQASELRFQLTNACFLLSHECALDPWHFRTPLSRA